MQYYLIVLALMIDAQFINCPRRAARCVRNAVCCAVQSVVSLPRLLAALVAAAPRTVCEVGVNGGHSSLLWLLGAPRARVIAFDLGVHRCVRPAARWLSRRFPGRSVGRWDAMVWYHVCVCLLMKVAVCCECE